MLLEVVYISIYIFNIPFFLFFPSCPLDILLKLNTNSNNKLTSFFLRDSLVPFFVKWQEYQKHVKKVWLYDFPCQVLLQHILPKNSKKCQLTFSLLLSHSLSPTYTTTKIYLIHFFASNRMIQIEEKKKLCSQTSSPQSKHCFCLERCFR